MVVTRNPLLCLDTNASIDIGVVTDIRRQGKSLDGQVKAIDIRNGVPHDKATMEYVTKLFGDRNKQLRGTAQFLNAVKGCSRLRLPEFAKIEHLRVRHDAQPPAPTVPITDAAHRISLEVFSRTKLSLQDSVILASAIDMRADALVSNDEDFKREFKSRTRFTAFGFTALQMLGKPLYLLDHRVPHSGGDAAPTLYAMVLRSLLSHYSNSKHPEAPKHPRFGHPLWVDRRRGTSEWYLAYRQPLVKGMKPYLVPGRDDLSIIDERSWTVCEIGSVHFFNESLPEGVSSKFIDWLRGQPSRRRRQWQGHFRLPAEGAAGFVDFSIALDGLPPAWEHWHKHPDSDSKRHAPPGSRGVIETAFEPPATSTTD